MTYPASSITFVSGTTISSSWANWINRKAVEFSTVADYASLADAVASGAAGLIFPSGTYTLTTDLSFPMPVYMLPGAVINVPTGKTLTFQRSFEAGVYQVFNCTGTGKVVFDHRRRWSGPAEWWGAAADGATDSYAAIMAALTALLTTELQAGDYLTSATVRVNLAHRSLVGAGCEYADTTAEATRLLVADGSQYGLQIGPDSYPGSINDMPRGIMVRDLYVGRAAAPVISSNCVGINVQWAMGAIVDRVKSAESMIGWRFYGTVACDIQLPQSVRATAGTGAGTDYFRGYWVDGSASIGAAGGNASLYLRRPSAGCNRAALQTASGSVGYYLDQKFTDTFLIWPESVSFYDGIRVTGTSAAGNTFENTDLHIEHPIMDQFHNAGIFITGLAEAGSVEITSPYCGPASAARASIWVDHSNAAVNVIGGQLVHGNSTAQPILIDISSGVSVRSTMVLEAGSIYPAVGVGASTNCRVEPVLKNRSVTGAAAVQITGACTGNIIDPTIMGKASAFTYGVQVVGTSDARNEYRCTGIDSGAISGGSGNKLVRNGVQITATGLSGTNMVSGVMS